MAGPRTRFSSLDELQAAFIAYAYNHLDAPAVATLRDAVEPFWLYLSEPNRLGRSTGPMLAWLDSPEWAEIEDEFARGMSVLSRLASLGPIHAGLARRFADQAVRGMVLIDESWVGEGRYWDGPAQALGGVLVRAKCRSAFEEPFENFVSSPWTEANYLEKQACWIEGTGVDEEEYRSRSRATVSDLRRLLRGVWRAMRPGAAETPSVRAVDRFHIPGLPPDDSFMTAALYAPRGNGHRVTLSRPALAMGMPWLAHRDPATPVSREEFEEWDFACANAVGPTAAEIGLHELTHALSTRLDLPLAEGTGLYASFSKVCAPEPPPGRYDMVGVSAQVRERGHQVNAHLGLAILNEVLTEAASAELMSRMAYLIPDSLKDRDGNARSAAGGRGVYGSGLGLAEAFLPGRSALDAMLSDDPLSEVVAGIRSRLSPSNADDLIAEMSMSADEVAGVAAHDQALAEAAIKVGIRQVMIDRMLQRVAWDDQEREAEAETAP